MSFLANNNGNLNSKSIVFVIRYGCIGVGWGVKIFIGQCSFGFGRGVGVVLLGGEIRRCA